MKRFVCLYAGDKEDEYCGVCDGIMAAMANGESVPATECPGFEPGETEIPDTEAEAETEVAEAEPINEEPVEEEPVKEEVVEEVVEEPKPVQPKAKPVKKPVKKETKKETKKEEPELKKEVKKEVKTEINKDEFSEITEIRIDSGVSFEAGNGSWFKLNYGETRKVCGSNEFIESVRKDMWDKANSEVDNQMADILSSMNTTK